MRGETLAEACLWRLTGGRGKFISGSIKVQELKSLEDSRIYLFEGSASSSKFSYRCAELVKGVFDTDSIKLLTLTTAIELKAIEGSDFKKISTKLKTLLKNLASGPMIVDKAKELVHSSVSSNKSEAEAKTGQSKQTSNKQGEAETGTAAAKVACNVSPGKQLVDAFDEDIKKHFGPELIAKMETMTEGEIEITFGGLIKEAEKKGIIPKALPSTQERPKGILKKSEASFTSANPGMSSSKRTASEIELSTPSDSPQDQEDKRLKTERDRKERKPEGNFEQESTGNLSPSLSEVLAQIESEDDQTNWGDRMEENNSEDNGNAVGGEWKEVTRKDKKTRITNSGRKNSTAENRSEIPGFNTRKTQQSCQPIILEGLKEEEVRNPLRLKRKLEEWNGKIKEIKSTTSGKILVFPKTEEDKKFMLKNRCGGISTREVKESIKPLFVVIGGISPEVSEAEITLEVGRPCKRLLASRSGGTATWKVKVTCKSSDDQKLLLKKGIRIGFRNYKAMEYNVARKPLICYNCQRFGHIASNCTDVIRCRYCSNEHSSKDCPKNKICCANCGKEHETSSTECEHIRKEMEDEEVRQARRKQTVRRADKKEKDESTEIAGIIALSICAVLKNTASGNAISETEVCDIVTNAIAKVRKITLNSNLIKRLAFDI